MKIKLCIFMQKEDFKYKEWVLLNPVKDYIYHILIDC